MSRIAITVVKDVSGNFYDPFTGTKLKCVGDSADGTVGTQLDKFKELRGTEGILKAKKSEIELTQLMILSTNTAGGELKARKKWKRI